MDILYYIHLHQLHYEVLLRPWLICITDLMGIKIQSNNYSIQTILCKVLMHY